MYLHANAKLGLAGRVALVRAIEDGLSLKAARRIVGCQGRISMRRRYAVVTAIGGAVAAYVLLARPRASPVGNDRSGVLPAPSRRRPSQKPEPHRHTRHRRGGQLRDEPEDASWDPRPGRTHRCPPTGELNTEPTLVRGRALNSPSTCRAPPSSPRTVRRPRTRG
jgi:hypothetical protein